MREKYRPYVEKFAARAVRLKDFSKSGAAASRVAMRHDIDHNIDIALKMAWIEHEAGLAASYFILHDAPYMQDPRLLEKLLQIQALGHEVGLHHNFVAQWYKGEIDSVEDAISKLLKNWRKAGIDISGLAAHGDPACYSAGFVNYWLFGELRPDDPFQSEQRLLAEGIRAPDSSNRFISYSQDYLQREDGARLDYWSLSMKDFGLDYEAVKTPWEDYFSDSGGSWLDGRDPALMPINDVPAHILMHPVHWRGAQRQTYFIGPARSGSKWLSQIIDQASTSRCEHEVTLNYRTDNAGGSVKNTTTRFRDLLNHPKEIETLVAEARHRSEAFIDDYAEANIYLAQVLDYLPHGPDTSFVHLVRDPLEVVRSLWQRGWYETPYDPRHPAFDIPGWDTLSQFEQICWYVRLTHEAMLSVRDFELRFEDLVADAKAYLPGVLSPCEIGILPVLWPGNDSLDRNDTAKWDVASPKDWPDDHKVIFDNILGPMRRELGYGSVKGSPGLKKAAPQKASGKKAKAVFKPKLMIKAEPYSASTIGSVSPSYNHVRVNGDEIGALTFSGPLNSYVLLGGGMWRRENLSIRTYDGADDKDIESIKDTLWPNLGGWPAEKLTVYTVDVAANIKGAPLRVICLSYNIKGHLIAQQDIGTISVQRSELSVHFKPSRLAARFNLALFSTAGVPDSAVNLTRFILGRQTENRANLGSPQATIKSLRAQSAAPSPQTFGPLIDTATQGKMKDWNAQVKISDKSWDAMPIDDNRPCYVISSGGTWHEASKNLLASRRGNIFAGKVMGEVERADSIATVYALFYNKDRALSYAVKLGNLSAAQNCVSAYLDVSSFKGFYVSLGVYMAPGLGGFSCRFSAE